MTAVKEPITAPINGIVSLIIPTLNSETFIEQCLQSIKDQNYPGIEIVVVDGLSKDRTVELARRYAAKIYLFGPDQGQERVFGAPYQRNFGARKCQGEYVYYVDVDMKLPQGLISDCLDLLKQSGADAVIIPELSRGKGFWSGCKALERQCYVDDDFIEAPRFFRRSVWEKLNGLDPEIGGDDWDLYHRFKKNGHKAVRTKSFVIHDEGELTLKKLAIKRYLYGKQVGKFLQRYGSLGVRQYSPFRGGYFRNRRLFLNDPARALGVIVMRTIEYTAGIFGFLLARINTSETQLLEGTQ